ncbi:hypothetical protein [Cellulomonas cellasea]|uniref:Lipoprotein n=1 Tax=Cellulomonas cellasea TaxID=43670 RepID=A0A7W4YE53_9CELL|nr:hypothetical protein [Cellulomonas cellasea]MBB2925256.1 hypothetical protein [Cellulomonas cellasea]
MAVAAALAGLSVLGAPPTAADPTGYSCGWETYPDGHISDVHLAGPLHVDVPDCRLTNVTVGGWVSVYPGARLTMDGSVVQGDVRTRGPVSMSDTEVHGDVFLGDGWGGDLPGVSLSAAASTVRGSVTGRADLVSLRHARVGGVYDVETQEMTRLRASTLTGPVTARGGRLVVHDSAFLSGLTADGAGDVLVCRTTVVGELRVTALTDYARLGVEGPHPCRTSVGGSVLLERNAHSIDLGDLHVAHHLVCHENTGPRRITGVAGASVGGQRVGQCLT